MKNSVRFPQLKTCFMFEDLEEHIKSDFLDGCSVKIYREEEDILTQGGAATGAVSDRVWLCRDYQPYRGGGSGDYHPSRCGRYGGRARADRGYAMRLQRCCPARVCRAVLSEAGV